MLKSFLRACCFIVALCVVESTAQEYGSRLGTIKRGGKVSFEPTGPGVLFDALDPVVRKWYTCRKSCMQNMVGVLVNTLTMPTLSALCLDGA